MISFIEWKKKFDTNVKPSDVTVEYDSSDPYHNIDTNIIDIDDCEDEEAASDYMSEYMEDNGPDLV